eukprot:352020-Chlamydomonas_euryale.AAC.14
MYCELSVLRAPNGCKRVTRCSRLSLGMERPEVHKVSARNEGGDSGDAGRHRNKQLQPLAKPLGSN